MADKTTPDQERLAKEVLAGEREILASETKMPDTPDSIKGMSPEARQEAIALMKQNSLSGVGAGREMSPERQAELRDGPSRALPKDLRPDGVDGDLYREEQQTPEPDKE